MLKRGAISYNQADLTTPLKPGEVVPCPRCDARHLVQLETRPGRGFSSAQPGVAQAVPNPILFIECPLEPGPIVVGIDGFALPDPIALTPRKKPA